MDSCFELVGSRQHGVAARSRSTKARSVFYQIHVVVTQDGPKLRCFPTSQRATTKNDFIWLIRSFTDPAYTCSVFVRGPVQFSLSFFFFVGLRTELLLDVLPIVSSTNSVRRFKRLHLSVSRCCPWDQPYLTLTSKQSTQ